MKKLTLKIALLRMESCLAMPVFVVSWMICAIVLAAKAGFLMAKSEGAAKSALLDKLLPQPKPQPPKSES